MKQLFYFLLNTLILFGGVFTTTLAQSMSNGSTTTCSTSFSDSGGFFGNYANNQNLTHTFYPSVAGQKLQVTFASFSTEAGFDFLSIYNGNSVAAPSQGSFSGTALPPTFTSTAADGSLTFRFTSNGSSTASGWLAALSCITTPQEINLQGGSPLVSIADGDTSPSIADNTDFGYVATSRVVTYTIQNTGADVLTISSIVSSGTNAADFVVGSVPSSVAAGGSATFTVTFTPGTVAAKTAIITITNNDSDEGIYDFAIGGTAILPTDALDFDGGDDYVSLITNPLATSTALTIELWYYPKTHNSFSRLVDFGDAPADNMFLAASVATSGIPRFVINVNNGGERILEAPSALTLNQWSHIAVTLTGTTATMYINGLQVAQNTSFDVNPSTLGATINNWLGRSQYADAYLNGIMDELRIWNVARSQTDIQNNTNTELIGNETGLVAYYTFDEGTAGANNTSITTPEIIDHVCVRNGTMNNFAKTGTVSNWVTGNPTITEVTQLVKQEINVQGGSPLASIVDGDITPNTADDTDFSSVAINRVVTYRIQNTGAVVLNISSIVSSGTNAADFVVSSIPTSVAAGGFATFNVTFTPSAGGVRNATITINSDDCNEAAYDFAVRGLKFYPALFVKTTGNDTNTGLNFTTDAFATVEKALSFAGAGTKIYVAAGTYKPTQQYDFSTGAAITTNPRAASFKIPNGVEVYGGFAGTETGAITQAVLNARNFATNTTILSGDVDGATDAVTGTFPALVYTNYDNNAYHVVYTKNVSSATKVDGVTIKGGNGNATFPNNAGGGIYNDGSESGNVSNPSLSNIVFSQNIALFGGVMLNNGRNSGVSSPSLTNCSFSQNNVTQSGGVMYNFGASGTSSPVLTNCTFSQNNADFGGGIYNYGVNGISSPSLTNCSFSQNNATSTGGGMYNYGVNGISSPVLTNCTFSQNTATSAGGGIYFLGDGGSIAAEVINCEFYKNNTHIGYDDGNVNQQPTFTNCTFTEATISAINISFWDSGMTPIKFENCIFWNNTAMKIGDGTNTLAVTYSIIEDNTYVGTGTINQNPLFTNAATGDLRLQVGSPAINAGNNSDIPVGVTTDLAGNPRIQTTTVDMGAYEFIPPPNITVTSTMTAFAGCQGTASATQTYTVAGTDLGTNDIVITAPTGYEISSTGAAPFFGTLNLTPTMGSVSITNITVRLTNAAALGTVAGDITHTSTGAITRNAAVTGTVNTLPTITGVSAANVTTAATTFNLVYTGTTGTPDQYAITTGATAMLNFVAVTNATLGASPLAITIPASAANTYDFNLTVRNSTTGCVSAVVPFTLTVTGATVPATALNFDGTDDHVVLANESTFDLATTLTIETRVFTPAVLPGAVQSIINKRNDSKANFGINFSNSFLYFYFNDGNYRLTSLNPNIIPLNQWVHFAYTLEQQGADVRAIAYINGVQVGTDLWVGVSLTNAQNNEPVRLGTVLTVLGNDEFFQGNMDEVRIWNVVKSASELLAKKDCELTGSEPNLLAYYNFNQGDGGAANPTVTALNDAAGTNDVGTLTNFTRTGATSNWITSAVLTACPIPAATATALNFDGTDDHVVLANESTFDLATTLTIETRVFTPAVLPGAVQSIINKRNDSKANFGINFSNSFLYFYFNDGNYRLTSLNPNIIPLNQWVHFAYTLEQQGANVRAIAYINGVQVGTDLWVGVSLTNAQNNEPVRLGTVLTALGNDEFFQGNMDEVRIWNVVKSQSELLAKKDCELTGSEPNLLAYYNFNQGDGGGANLGLISLNDAASPNDAGTLTNFTRTGATSNWITSAVLTGCSSPTITSFLPTSGGVDQVVTITGTNFTGATLVRIGGVSARSFTVVNATTITAVVGDGFTTGLVEVINGATGTSAALTPQNFTRNSCVNTITGLVVTPTTNAGTGFAGFDVSWNLGAGTYTAINVFYKPQSGLGSNFYIGRSFAANATSCKLWQINGNSQTYEIYVQGVCTGANSDRVSTTAITTASGSTCSMPVLTPLSVSGTSITFTWNTVPNAYLYQPIYQECDAAGNKINGGQGSTAYLTPAMTATQSWTASQLKPNTFYRFYVRTHCVQGDQSNVISPWSSVGDYVFAQTGAGIACTAPSPTLGAPGTTNGYASQVINWAAVPSATNGYGIYFRENSQTNWNVYHLGNVLTYTISGLKQGATYTYFVYGACSNGQAPRSAEATFTAGTGQTYDCNSATTNVSTIFSNPVGATLSWTTTPAGQQVGKLYGVQYVDTNNPTVTNVVYTDSTKISLFAGISSGKTYTYNLQTYCDGIGQWYVNTGTFTTPGLPNIASQKQDETLPAVANFGSALQVYPNPTDNKLTVELGLDNSTNVGIKLTDATGRMVFNETVSANGLNFRHDIDMKNLASGVYMLMVNVEGKTTVKRIVRQ